ncbi:hypothetical protein [Campylobacter concisus]|uniref:hypothetical protein n=1 Tax=Campylobacter concisus TaxID=199 RepID=UPI0015E179C8|nr:hypothetical protein [Campylobacter concisus]
MASKQRGSISHDCDRHNRLNISYMGWATERIFLPLLHTSMPKATRLQPYPNISNL